MDRSEVTCILLDLFAAFDRGKRQALLNVVPGECTDDDITPISFYPLLPTLY